MTRRRFVKLMMARGYSRNGANQIAAKVQEQGRTYSEVYNASIAVARLADAIIPAFRNAVETIGTMAKAASEAATAFVKTFRETMAAAEQEKSHP